MKIHKYDFADNKDNSNWCWTMCGLNVKEIYTEMGVHPYADE